MPLTCLACRTIFAAADQQREHYQTEWHRYNLKRKIVELPPVSLEEFELKRITAELQNKSSSAAGNTRSTHARSAVPTEEFDPDKQQLRCVICQKNFHSTKALNSHLNSNKHIINERNSREKNINLKLLKSQNSCESDLSNGSTISSHLAAEINANSTDCVQLIEKPEKQSLDVDRAKVPNNPFSYDDEVGEEGDWESDDDFEDCEENEDEEYMDVDNEEQDSEAKKQILAKFDPKRCLFCFENKMADSVDECLNHMSQSHSFFIPYFHLVADVNQLLCYLHFKIEVLHQCIFCSKRSKRFRKGSAVRSHMFHKGHNRMAHDSPEQFLEYVSFYNEPEESEDASTDDPTGEKLDELLTSALEDGYSLVLPSGAVIGHRALMRYYKQKPRAPPVEAGERIKENSRKYIGFRANQDQYQSNSVVLAKNFTPIKEMKAIEKFRMKNQMRVQVNQNNLKTHSRDQNFWNMRY